MAVAKAGIEDSVIRSLEWWNISACLPGAFLVYQLGSILLHNWLSVTHVCLAGYGAN